MRLVKFGFAILTCLVFTLPDFAQQISLSVPSESASSLPARKATVSPPVAFEKPGRKDDSIPKETTLRAMEGFEHLPLSFEVNEGQARPAVAFLSRGADYALFLTRGADAVLSLRAPEDKPLSDRRSSSAKSRKTGTTSDSLLNIKFLGANPTPNVEGLDELPGKFNYFIGKDPSDWHTGVKTFAKVQYRNVYPGIDVVFYGRGREIESDFLVSSGANPSALRLQIQGAKRLRTNSDGDLIIKLTKGNIRLKKPTVYQKNGQVKEFLPTSYQLIGSDQVSFKISRYDRSKPLIIDPVLSYSTYLGGSSQNVASGIAIDSAGSAYVTGSTGSSNFPTTAGSFDPNYPVPAGEAAFVAKLSPDGTALVYSTFLGGSTGQFNFASNISYSKAIKVDTNGNVYIVGDTDVTDFPTVNAFQTSCKQCSANTGTYTTFVSKLDPTGSALLYSTYFGGTGSNTSGDLAIDKTGAVYMTGSTRAADFPVTPGALDTLCGTDGHCDHDSFGQPYSDGFISKLDTTKIGSASLIYSSYLGGGNGDSSSGISVDANGNAYVVGTTASSDFPTTQGAFQQQCAPQACFNGSAFVTKINASGSALLYSTYLAGPSGTSGSAIAVDTDGNAYVTGSMRSTADFPVTPGAFQTQSFFSPAFIAKLNSTGTALIYGTYLGANATSVIEGIALDKARNAYVAGWTQSSTFPLVNPTQAKYGGGSSDVFVSVLNSNGAQLLFSTYLGGSNNDGAFSGGFPKLVLNADGDVYVSGATQSGDFPTTSGAFQTTLHGLLGNSDAFVAKISGLGVLPAAALAVTLSSASLSFPGQTVNTTSAALIVTVTNSGNALLNIAATPTITGTNASNFVVANGTTCISGASLAVSASCILNVIFTPSTAASESATLSIYDNASNSPQIVSLTGTGVAPAATPPSVTSTSPSQAIQGGQVRPFLVKGKNFQSGAAVSFSGGQDITIKAQSTSPTQIVLNLAISAAAALGAHTVTVTNPDGQAATFGAALNLLGIPAEPQGLSAVVGNQAVYLSWNATPVVPEGYNVYVNGVKANS